MEVTIVLKVKDIEIKLTVDEARKLADTLNGLVGEKGIVSEPYYLRYPYHPEWLWRNDYYPSYTDGTPIPINNWLSVCSET